MSVKRAGFWRLSVIGICLSLAPLSLLGLQIRDYDPERHLRFAEGTFPAVPESNETFWAARRNFAGVGWSADDRRKNFALISPRHFVGANHFRPAAGSEIRFRSLDGTVRGYTCERFFPLRNSAGEETDLFVGELSEAIPASHKIPFYPVFGGDESELSGREILVYGHGPTGPRAGRGVVGAFSDSFGSGSSLNATRNFGFEFVEATAGPDDAHGETGDSGSPSFVAMDGMLALVGIHSTIRRRETPEDGLRVTTFDSYVPAYAAQIEAHLAAADERLVLTPVPRGEFRVAAIARSGDEVVLEVENPAQLPFAVERTGELSDTDWETVATGDGTAARVPFPTGAERMFWRLRRFPLPKDLPD